MKFFRLIVGIAFLIVANILSYYLLSKKLIGGPEFVVLVIALTMTALVIIYIHQIQELSIGGNIIKLKEAKIELQVTIDQLKSIKLSTYRMLLLKSLYHSGVFGSSDLVDSRVNYFLILLNEIKEADSFFDLKSEIKEQLQKLLKDQISNFYGLFYDRNFNDGDEFPKPMFFYIELTKEIIEKVKKNQTPIVPYDIKKKELIAAIDAYAKLYVLLTEVDY